MLYNKLCDSSATIQNLYGYDILKIVENAVGKDKADELFNSGKRFGGEATLWSEKVYKLIYVSEGHNVSFKTNTNMI